MFRKSKRQGTEDIINNLFFNLMKQKVATSKTLSSLTGLSIPTTVKYMSLIHGIQEKPKIEIHTPQKTSGEVKTSEIVYILREDS